LKVQNNIKIQHFVGDIRFLQIHLDFLSNAICRFLAERLQENLTLMSYKFVEFEFSIEFLRVVLLLPCFENILMDIDFDVLKYIKNNFNIPTHHYIFN